jgi:hypothetical protein
MIRLAALALWTSCGVAETGLLLCPPGTTSTVEGCLPAGGTPDASVETGDIRIFALDGDFGRAPVGGVYEKMLAVTNEGSRPARIELVRVDGDGQLFAIDAFRTGEPRTLEPGERIQATIEYFPRASSARASFVFNTCARDGFCMVERAVLGSGVEEAFSCRGGDVGAIAVGQCLSAQLGCTNDTDYGVTADSIGFTGSPSFFPLAIAPAVVASGRAISLEVQFCPFERGEHRGRLDLMASVPRGRNVSSTDLEGVGLGIGELECQPSSVAFGPTRVGSTDSIFVACRASGSLVIGELELVPGTAPGLVGRLYLNGALVSPPAMVSENDLIDVELVFTPPFAGDFRDALHIEHDAGRVRIEITATAFDDQGCTLDHPASIDFGSVPIGTGSSATAFVSNVGTGTCSIERLGFDMSTDPAFTLSTPVPSQALLLPGETIELLQADFFPTRMGPHRGRFEFSLPDLGEIRSVDLTGAGAGGGGGYSIVTVPNTPLLPSGGSDIVFSNADDGFAMIDIGFPFAFDGVPVSDAWVSTNGFISFAGANGLASFINEVIPAPQDPDGFVAWWWDDLHTNHPQGPAARVTTALYGVPGSQVRAFTFLDVAAFGNNTPLVNAEIRLFEQTHEIEVHYGSITVRGVDFSGSAGWESFDGLEGADLGCSPGCSAADWPADTIIRYVPVP